MRRSACSIVSGITLAAAVAGCTGTSAPTAHSSPASSCPTTTAGAHAVTCLTFSGAVNATVTSRIAVTPTQTQSAFNEGGGALFTTQCIIAAPGSDAMWSAEITVATPGNEWMIGISMGQGSGNPTPGRHTLVGSMYPGQMPPGALYYGVTSREPLIASIPSGEGMYSYLSGAKLYTATVNPSLRSGSLDVTLSPAETDRATVTINGTWSCA